MWSGGVAGHHSMIGIQRRVINTNYDGSLIGSSTQMQSQFSDTFKNLFSSNDCSKVTVTNEATTTMVTSMTSSAEPPSPLGFGQTEWTRIWASKFLHPMLAPLAKLDSDRLVSTTPVNIPIRSQAEEDQQRVPRRRIISLDKSEPIPDVEQAPLQSNLVARSPPRGGGTWKSPTFQNGALGGSSGDHGNVSRFNGRRSKQFEGGKMRRGFKMNFMLNQNNANAVPLGQRKGKGPFGHPNRKVLLRDPKGKGLLEHPRVNGLLEHPQNPPLKDKGLLQHPRGNGLLEHPKGKGAMNGFRTIGKQTRRNSLEGTPVKRVNVNSIESDNTTKRNILNFRSVQGDWDERRVQRALRFENDKGFDTTGIEGNETETDTLFRKLRPIVIDGSSAAYDYGEKVFFDWEGIYISAKYFMDVGCDDITVVIPQEKLERGMSKNERFVDQLKKKNIMLLPCSANCVYNQLVIKVAEKKNALVLSNSVWDRPNQISPALRNIIHKTVRFHFNCNVVPTNLVISEHPFGPEGPPLKEMLRI